MLANGFEPEVVVERRDAEHLRGWQPERLADVGQRVRVDVPERLLRRMKCLDQRVGAIAEAAHPGLDDLPPYVVAWRCRHGLGD
jgi:hypothetical protein